MEREFAWKKLNDKEVDKFAKDYKEFLEKAKTEREVVRFLVEKAKKKKFKPIEEASSLKAGDKVYAVFRDKLVFMAVIGKKPITEGVRLVGSHMDSPRIDIKPVPIYEDSGIAMLKTHYYGGIKKYQWVNIPLAIHGVVVLKDGTKKEIVIGEKEDEPAIIIPDVLPHLGRKKQDERKGLDVVKGEELHAVLGNKPLENEEKDAVKKQVLKILEEEYGIKEEDLISADLELVPALKPRDAGIDRSMIAAYGQDDRVCVYTSFRALTEVENPEYTIVGMFVDKEEIGSVGDTSATSRFFEYFMTELIARTTQAPNVPANLLFKVLANSRAISADVNAVVHPLHKDLHDLNNAGFLGKGVILTKYGGRGGKYYSSEAHAEYLAWIRKVLDENNVPWQPGLLGKVDIGGGGTIAMFIAERGFLVVDMGPGVLSMHSPYEITSKADVYSAYLAYKAFYSEGKTEE